MVAPKERYAWRMSSSPLQDRMAAAGAPLRAIQEWMGPTDSRTTSLYADYAPDPQNGTGWAQRAFSRPSDGQVGIATLLLMNSSMIDQYRSGASFHAQWPAPSITSSCAMFWAARQGSLWRRRPA
jgi:hypothetical protein